MQLYMSPTSPYARVARAVLHEKGVTEQVTYHALNPWDSPGDLLGANPYSLVPALVTDGGGVITESLLIAFYLERRFPEPSLVPDERFELVFRKAGLGQGMIDAAVAIVKLRKFRDDLDNDPIVVRRRAAMERALPELERVVDSRAETLDLGDIIIAAALDYVTMRFEGFDWRALAPDLSDWADVVGRRPSLAETHPER